MPLIPKIQQVPLTKIKSEYSMPVVHCMMPKNAYLIVRQMCNLELLITISRRDHGYAWQ